MDQQDRRHYGAHLTSVDIFKEYILPKIKDKLYDYVWVDLYCGEGNLILPILEEIPIDKREKFFKENIFLFDVQKKMVEKAIKKALKYGISEETARKNIILEDTLSNFPKELINLKKPIYHITNPPYLYLGYIAKNEQSQQHMKYFEDINKGYQDLYQIAMINDLRNKFQNMIYIIPSNFLFGNSVSNKIRQSFLPHYTIKEAIIFEKKIFEHTGINVVICFFEKTEKINNSISFSALKINSHTTIRNYNLNKKNKYKAGEYFEEYIEKNKFFNPLRVDFYLKKSDLDSNVGKNRVILLDSKNFNGKEYLKKEFFVNDKMYKNIKANPLFIRTVDSGSETGRIGLYEFREVFDVDGIFVDGNTYRTNPIQIFINPTLDYNKSLLLKNNFNKILEELREKTDSEFMTTYKYSNNPSAYVRKYLGLTQVKKLISTIQI